MRKTVGQFQAWLRERGRDEWTLEQLEQALKVAHGRFRYSEDSDTAPGRMLIDEEKFLSVWHDRDVDGKDYVRFGISVGQGHPAPAPVEVVTVAKGAGWFWDDEPVAAGAKGLFSWFSSCPRDKEGHCKPKDGGSDEGGKGKEKKGPRSPDRYSAMSHLKLASEARQRGIDFKPHWSEEQIADALRAADQKQEGAKKPAEKPADRKPERSSAEKPRSGKIAVTYDKGGEEAVQGVFGKAVDGDLLGAMANALPGATVKVSSPKAGMVRVETTGDGYRAERFFYKKGDQVVVKNENFEIDDSSPLKGQGISIFARQVESLRKAGVSRIVTRAGGSPQDKGLNGYYTWPRMGYDAPLDEGRFESGRVYRAAREKFPEAKTVLDIFATPSGREWWKDNGGEFGASFDLDPNSRSSKVLAAYLDERKKQGK